MEFRDLGAQYAALKDDVDVGIVRVLGSGRFVGGPEVAALERELAEYVGVKHCITCGNGTDALQLALMAWGVGPGDAVVVPDFTFFSSGEVVAAVGATPVFADVLEGTFNLDPAQIAPACAAARGAGLSPKAAVAVDLFGLLPTMRRSARRARPRACCCWRTARRASAAMWADAARARSATYRPPASFPPNPSAATATAARCSPTTTGGRSWFAATPCTARAP